MIKNLSKIFIKNNFHTFFILFLINVRGLVLAPILINSLGTSIYGGYVLVIITLSFVSVIAPLGVGFHCQRYLPVLKEAAEKRKIFYPQFFFSLISIFIFSILTVIIWPWISVKFPAHRIQHCNYANFFIAFLSMLIPLILVFLKQKLSLDLLIGIEIVVRIPIILYLISVICREIGIKFYYPKFKELIKDIPLGFPIIINTLLIFWLNFGDRYIIAAFISVTAVGFYNPAYTLGSLPLFIPKVFELVLPPFLYKAVDEKKIEESQALVNYSLVTFLLIAIPFVAGSCVIADDILTVLTNAEIARHAFMVTPILALGFLFYGMTLILNNIFLVRMNTFFLMKISLAAAALNFLLNVFLIAVFKNILLAAVSNLLSYLFVFIWTYNKAIKQWAIHIKTRVIFKIILASGIMEAALWGIKNYLLTGNPRVGSLFLLILAGAAVYSLALYAMGMISLKTIAMKDFD